MKVNVEYSWSQHTRGLVPRPLLGTDDMPQHDPYDNNSQNKQAFPKLDEEPEKNPKYGDQHVSAEILLSRGDKVARSQVMHCKKDADGNPLSRSNQNPIPDIGTLQT